MKDKISKAASTLWGTRALNIMVAAIVAWWWCGYSYEYAATHSSPLLTQWLAANPGAFETSKNLYILLSLLSAFVLVLVGRNLHRMTIGTRKKKIEKSTLPAFPNVHNIPTVVIGEVHVSDKIGVQIERPTWAKLTGDGLFGSMLILGRPGTGKTTSLILPAADQLLQYQAKNPALRVGGLVLDVKGNLWGQMHALVENRGRGSDAITIEPGGLIKYNPIHYPGLSPEQLADELMQVVVVMAGGKMGGDSYWTDKARVVIGHGIGLVRGAFGGYVTIFDLYQIFENEDALTDVIELAQSLITTMGEGAREDMEYRISFFQGKEWTGLDSKIKGIIDSEVKRVLTPFSIPKIKRTFCAEESELNFPGFDSVWNEGKIVGLKMSKSTHGEAAQAVATLLKIAFQRSMLSRPSRSAIDDSLNQERPVLMVIDECQEMITGYGMQGGDPGFFALSRESKCIGMLASQSFAGIQRALGNDEIRLRELNGAIVNKVFFCLGDERSANVAADLAGKEYKMLKQSSISENVEGARYNLAAGQHMGDKTDISTSASWQQQKEHTFGPEVIQFLPRNAVVALLSDGREAKKPAIVYTKPVYEAVDKSWFAYRKQYEFELKKQEGE